MLAESDYSITSRNISVKNISLKELKIYYFTIPYCQSFDFYFYFIYICTHGEMCLCRFE